MEDLRINIKISKYYKKFQKLKKTIESDKGLDNISMTDIMRLLINDGVEKYINKT